MSRENGNEMEQIQKNLERFLDREVEKYEKGEAGYRDDVDMDEACLLYTSYDACRKIAILSSLMTGKTVRYEDIYTEGITKITKEDFLYAKKMNKFIKLLASAKALDGGYAAKMCIRDRVKWTSEWKAAVFTRNITDHTLRVRSVMASVHDSRLLDGDGCS